MGLTPFTVYGLQFREASSEIFISFLVIERSRDGEAPPQKKSTTPWGAVAPTQFKITKFPYHTREINTYKRLSLRH